MTLLSALVDVRAQISTDYKDLQGNIGMLLGLLLLTWTLAAIGEELAYRWDRSVFLPLTWFAIGIVTAIWNSDQLRSIIRR